MLNSVCESIVITQGSVYTTNPAQSQTNKPPAEAITKGVFDTDSTSSHFRHVVLDQHEEYLLDSSRALTTPNKKDKIEVIDTWHDRTVINGSGTVWRSPSLSSFKATKHIQPSTQAQAFVSSVEPHSVQMHTVPSYDVRYRANGHIEIPSLYGFNPEKSEKPEQSKPESKSTRDVALSPILMEPKSFKTSSQNTHEKVDRSCQYSPPPKHDLGLQCRFEHFTSSTQVASYEIPNFLITNNGTQTINDANVGITFDDSGIQTHIPNLSPSLSTASSDHPPTIQSGSDYTRKLNGLNISAVTVTQYTDDNYYLPSSDNNQTMTQNRTTNLERSADSGILVDEQVC